MGLLFSMFRKKAASSKEILEGLEEVISKNYIDIKKLTDYKQRNIYQEKTFIGYLLILSFITYLIGALIFYIYYSPQNWLEYVLYSIPLVLFPIVIYLVKKLLNMYFAHKKAQYDQRLSDLQEEKRKVLNEVMENETFNVARELLQRFNPQHPLLRATRDGRGRDDRTSTPQRREGGGELRQRRQAQTPHPALLHQQHTRTVAQTVPRPTRPSSQALPLAQPAQPPTLPSSQQAHPPTLPSSQQAQPPTQTSSQQAQPPTQPSSQQSQPPTLPSTTAPSQPQVPSHHTTQFIPPGMCLGPAPGPPTPSPILPRDRSNLDKMVEYLVGDGPNNRYALVCSSCHSHNGMALRDEFEYISFRCAYCYHLNPARRNKPVLRTLTEATLPGESTPPDTVATERNEQNGTSDVRGSHVTGSDVRGSHVTGSDVRGSHVTGSDVRSSHMTGSDVRGSHVTGSDVAQSNDTPTTDQAEVEEEPPKDHTPPTD